MALRGDPAISAETRAKVRAAAESLGYKPNPLVSSLMASLRASGGKGVKRTCSVAFLKTLGKGAPAYRKAFHEKYFEGALRRGEELGYLVESYSLEDPGMSAGRLEKIIRSRGVDGLLIAPLPVAKMPFQLEWDHYAVAVLGYTMSDAFSVAAHHHFRNMQLALAQIARREYRRPGICLSEELNKRVGRVWLGAFLEAQLHLPPRDRVPPCMFEQEKFSKTFAAWVRKYEPDVVVSSHGPPLCETLADLGKECPRDIGVVTLSHQDGQDSLSGIDEDAGTLGALGLELVVEQLNRNERGIPRCRKIVLQDGFWRDGTTTRPVPHPGANSGS